MAVDVNSALSKAYDDLRTIDTDLSALSGIQDRFLRKRSAGDSTQFLSGGRRVQDGGRKIIIAPENSAKRGRYTDDTGTPDHRIQRDYSPPSRPHRTLQSSVVMPTIETKSRNAVINEMKKHEKREDLVRNKRLLGNLLVGTLRQFQKEEKTVGSKGNTQIEKQKEVERRLEETEKENKERMLREREQLLVKRREKELEIQALRRQKAIEQSAEEKMKHFRRLACFIQTQTKPPLFFLPAKHTLRTLELLKESSKKIETLIELRKEEMERELRRLESYTTSKEIESDHEYGDENSGGLKSTIVVKNEQSDEMVDDLTENKIQQKGERDDENWSKNGSDKIVDADATGALAVNMEKQDG